MTITTDESTSEDRGQYQRNSRIRSTHLQMMNKVNNLIYARQRIRAAGFVYKGDTAADYFQSLTGTATQTNQTSGSSDLWVFNDLWIPAKVDSGADNVVIVSAYGMDIDVTVKFVDSTQSVTVNCPSSSRGWAYATLASATFSAVERIEYEAASSITPNPELGDDRLYAVLVEEIVLEPNDMP